MIIFQVNTYPLSLKHYAKWLSMNKRLIPYFRLVVIQDVGLDGIKVSTNEVRQVAGSKDLQIKAIKQNKMFLTEDKWDS